MNYKISTLSLLFAILLSSCGKDDVTPNSNEVSFSLKTISSNSGRTAQSHLENAESILVTIEKMDGSPTDYTLEKIQLYNVNNEFISEKITLNLGEYQLVEFFVLDGDNNITHIAPLEGSEQGQNVSNPLPIQFTVAANEITSIEVEVISAEFLSLEDFGLAGFILSEINLFQFLVSVSEQGNHDNLLSATIRISNEDYEFTKDLQAIANNSLVIKDGYSSYGLTIEKEGYSPFNYTFSRDSLGNYSSIPLTIELISSTDELTIQERLDNGESPFEIIDSGVVIDNLYGKKYAGGLIFYLNTVDEFGIVAANGDQSVGIEWGCTDLDLSGANGVEVGDGAQNTLDINNECGDSNFAAKLCQELTLNEYDDWFLPSIDELNLMYENLALNNLGNFSDGLYWSSFEFNSNHLNPALAGSQNFSNGGTFATLKSQEYYVRAARYF